jgi:hypothetical protein
MSDTTAETPAPPGEFRLTQMLPTLAVDVAAPIVIFNLLQHFGAPLLWSLVAGGLAPLANNLRVWITFRRLEPLGMIVIGFFIVGAAASLISGNVFFALIKDSFLTGAGGLVFLGSLFARRPLMFYIARQFVAGDDAARLEWWNGLWQHAEFRGGMRLVTATWGVVYLAEALLRVVFALTLKPAQVVAISPIMGFGATIALIAWTRRHMLAIRARREAQAAAAP